MNYELAKKLKDAGFPTKEPNCDCSILWKSDKNYQKHINESHYYDWEPILEELLDACGDRIMLNHNESGLWTASKHGEQLYIAEISENREEAVARLWLALNK